MNDLTGYAVGFIGLGLMGRPMALNLHCAGATVTVHNRSRAPVEALAAKGLRTADSAGTA
ncbi:MAG TPA: NAD(P)-binding domain-containing protein, partial [Plasticicumulans sp.]|nr:NAD(P)-binding domain-containing protein [Plasticicumulans sp.]